MENILPKGVIFLSQLTSESVLPVLMASFKRLQQQDFDLVVVLNMSFKENMKRLFDNAGLTSITFIEITSLENPQLPFLNLSKPAFFFENGNLYTTINGIECTSKMLREASNAGPVYVEVQCEALSEIEWNRLKYSSTALLKLDGDLCETIVTKKDGSRKKTLEQFEIDFNYVIKAKKYVPPSTQIEEATTSNGPALPKTTFDMGLKLSEEERTQKYQTKLPFQSAQNEKGLVNLNINAGKKIRAGGQIIYTPDQADDMDDSDPDDDLMI